MTNDTIANGSIADAAPIAEQNAPLEHEAEHDDDMQYADEQACGTEFPTNEFVASRTVRSVEFGVAEDYALIVTINSSTYSCPFSWDEALLIQALSFNVLPVISFEETCHPILKLTDDIDCSDDDAVIPASAWSGYVDAVNNVTYKLKNKDTKFSRVQRVEKLLGEIRDIVARIVAQRTQLRVMGQSSPTAHAVSGELTMGSTAERAAIESLIESNETAAHDKLAEVAKQLKLINEAIAETGNTDSGWQVTLPTVIGELSKLNRPYPSDKFDPNLLPIANGLSGPMLGGVITI